MTPSAGPGARRRYALAVLCFVQFMLVLDETVVNVALPSVQNDLGFGTAHLTWVVNAYVLAFGGLLMLFGRVADLLGRRRLFLAGVAVFVSASLACGVAQEPWQLVTARFAQGTGAAMTSPAALALITLLFPGGKERARALGLWGGIAALGGTSGLVISGALTGLASWRWIFLINLPIGAAALVLLPLLVAESRAARRGRLDVAGAVLGTGALVSLVYGLLETAASGWDGPAPAALLLAVVLAGSFIAVEARVGEPLVPLPFLASRTRAVANGTGLLFAAAFFAMSFLLALHLQIVLGYDPLTAGLAHLPYGAGVLLGVAASSRAVPRLGSRWIIVLSCLLGAAGLLLLAGVSPNGGYACGVLPGVLLASVGSGLGFPALAMAAVADTTEEDAGLGSAVFSTAHQVGGAVGLAALAGVAARRSEAVAGSTDPLHALTEGFSLAFTTAAVVLTLSGLLVAVLLREEHR